MKFDETFEAVADRLGCHACVFRSFKRCEHPGSMGLIIEMRRCPLVAEVREIGRAERVKVQKPDQGWRGPRYGRNITR